MKLSDITVEQFMHVSLLVETYKNNESKFREEITKYFHGTLEVEKRDSDETISCVMEMLLEKPPHVQRFWYKGVEYGFIPNLDAITTAEFVDLDVYMKEGKQLHKIAAILYRPVTKSRKRIYDIEKYEGTSKYSDVMMGVSYKIAIGAMLFFWDLRLSLLEALNTYTLKTKMKQKIQ